MGKSDYTFRYKVRNWPEYNRALVKRGQLTLWFDTEAVAAWRHPGPFEGRGRPKVYADAAIQCALVLNSVFPLNLRTTQGFLQSIVALMALDLPVPNYSTVSRRQSAVDVRLSVGPTDRPRHVVIDSTGLKIYGAGEWHIRKHRTLRRRTWRKLHLGVDETTKEIVAMDLTASNVHDARRLSSLLSKAPGSIGQVSADRAYDTGPLRIDMLSDSTRDRCPSEASAHWRSTLGSSETIRSDNRSALTSSNSEWFRRKCPPADVRRLHREHQSLENQAVIGV